MMMPEVLALRIEREPRPLPQLLAAAVFKLAETGRQPRERVRTAIVPRRRPRNTKDCADDGQKGSEGQTLCASRIDPE
jgi:hypothetical protein